MKTYLRHRIENVIEIKELIALEFLNFESRYIEYAESHDFWELCFVKEGSLLLIADGEECVLKSGEMIVISPGHEHIYKNTFGGCLAYVICFESQSYSLRAIANRSFKIQALEEASMDILIREANGTFEYNESEQLLVKQNPNFGGQQAVILQLEYLFICCIRQFSAQKNANVVFLDDEDFYKSLTEIILEYFKNNITKKLSLSQICKKINYSRSFLCKTFKEQTGKTLIAYFNDMKMEEAMKMLTVTDMTATKIAQELGFGDAKYFNTLFKKKTGMTPAAYRKNHKKK